ncbi:hypothetical protein ACUTAF_12940 [Pseudomonas sp. SP16.1]|uniref:hypothetical protein n=1 Tax=Pseudomonas sp. SP16.1 TaxID=3458854 RepID=UPI0040467AC7
MRTGLQTELEQARGQPVGAKFQLREVDALFVIDECLMVWPIKCTAADDFSEVQFVVLIGWTMFVDASQASSPITNTRVRCSPYRYWMATDIAAIGGNFAARGRLSWDVLKKPLYRHSREGGSPGSAAVLDYSPSGLRKRCSAIGPLYRLRGNDDYFS